MGAGDQCARAKSPGGRGAGLWEGGGQTMRAQVPGRTRGWLDWHGGQDRRAGQGHGTAAVARAGKEGRAAREGHGTATMAKPLASRGVWGQGASA